MSLNFKILAHRNSDNLHLKLSGDFDGQAAGELLDAILRYGFSAVRIFVHTDGLSCVHPDGKALFWSGLPEFVQTRCKLVFTGNHKLAA